MTFKIMKILVFISLLLFSCSNNNKSKTILKGQYIIDPKFTIVTGKLVVYLFNNSSLKYIKDTLNSNKKIRKLDVEIINEKIKSFQSFYTVPMTSDGHFQVEIKERGEYIVYIESDDVKGYIKKDINIKEYDRNDILMSNRYTDIFIDFKEGETHTIDNLFMSSPIKINLPKYNKSYKKRDLIFEWDKIYLADLYNLYIYKVSKDNFDSKKLIPKFNKAGGIRTIKDLEVSREIYKDVLNKEKKSKKEAKKNTILGIYTLKTNRVSYKDFKKIELIKEDEGEVDFKNAKPVKEIFNKLTPGEYILQIDAYKYVDNKKRIIKIANSSTAFFIKK